MAAGNEHIIRLLEKYSRKEASPGEIDQLLTLLRSGSYDETVVSFLESRLETFEPDNEYDIAFWKSRLTGGAQQITGAAAVDISSPVTPVHRVHFLRRWGWAAASVILLLSIGAYLWTAYLKRTMQQVPVAQANHIAPGKNGAILTLADGSQVVLDSLGNGVVATQNGMQLSLVPGMLTYDSAAAATSEVAYNTMTTPKGRQFIVTLSDGTHVWLNAASSLRYPTVFTGNERRVAVTGEAYFEVAHNAKMPFKVNVNGKAMVEVLGTHFNVNAYENEAAIETTLLEGRVQVSRTGNGVPGIPAVTLKPNQQAQLMHNSKQPGIKVKTLSDVDGNKIVSWKIGKFDFNGASLDEVMRQLERWYDIEVVFEKGVPDVEFEGKMTKDVPLKDLLVMLERSDVHFRIDGRKLIVLP